MQELTFFVVWFVTDSLFCFYQAPKHPLNNVNIQELSAAAASMMIFFSSRILEHAMTMNSLLYSVIVHEMFPGSIILETFEKD